MIDIVIIGAGPAGVTAAIYAVRAGLSVRVIEAEMVGGQAATTPEIENFPPFDKITGFEFATKMAANLEKMDIPVEYGEVNNIKKESDGFTINLQGNIFATKTIIIANGAKRRKLHCENEEKFTGRGVSWCAVCDGNFFKNKITAVNGGGNSALEDALYLSGLCEKVYLIHRREQFRATDNLVEKVMSNDKISILTPYTIEKINGENSLESLTVKNLKDGALEEIEVSGLFEAIGLEAENEAFKELTELDKSGYIITDENCATSCAGIFAAGDTRSKNLRQISTAVADGALAATQAYNHIKKI